MVAAVISLEVSFNHDLLVDGIDPVSMDTVTISLTHY